MFDGKFEKPSLVNSAPQLLAHAAQSVQLRLWHAAHAHNNEYVTRLHWHGLLRSAVGPLYLLPEPGDQMVTPAGWHTCSKEAATTHGL